MKGITFVALLGLLFLAAPEGRGQKHYLSTDLLSPAMRRHGAVRYERFFSSGNSMGLRFELGRYFYDKSYDFGQLDWTKRIGGYGFTPEYRKYWQHKSRLNRPVGPFWGVYGKYFHGRYTQKFDDVAEVDVTQDFVAAGVGGLLGFKYKHPDQMWFVEGLGGLGWGYTGLTSFEYEMFPNQVILWRIELSVGYSFW
jgi:hypothetical protein